MTALPLSMEGEAMFTKGRLTLVLLLVIIVFMPPRSVAADTGPKPTMDFQFMQSFPGQAVTIVSGTLFECDRSDCQDAKPLVVGGPQRFTCGTTTCHALAYGFSDYHRLLIQFSDGKARQSNIFKTAQFQSVYKVTIRQVDLLVEPQISLNLFSPWTYILLCLCCLIVIALVVVAIVLLVRSKKVRK
ncbi:MAG: hypothetical protein ABSB41_02780 [Anaerolineales bacterium]|jgi:hypothetical protein